MVLHHELLLALAGHVGGEIFVERDGTFVLAEGLPLLDRSEQVAVSDLLPLGALYRDLNAFVERHLCGTLAAGASGLYVRALCRGIDAELDAYRHALVVIEDACKMAAADGLGAYAARACAPGTMAEAEVSAGLSIVRMQHEMTDYRSTIPALHRLATIVDDEGLQGARVLEAVHAQASSLARTPTGNCLRRVLRHCNATLLHQARGWMIHGVRFDPHAEFFVQPATAISSAIRRRAAGGSGNAGDLAAGSTLASGSRARTPRTPVEADGSTLGTPRTPNEPEGARLAVLPATSYRTAHRPARAAGRDADDADADGDDGGTSELFGEISDLTEQVAADWRELGVSLYDKPSYITLRLAERVLFIGKAARVLEHRAFLAVVRPPDAAHKRAGHAAAAAAASAVRLPTPGPVRHEVVETGRAAAGLRTKRGGGATLEAVGARGSCNGAGAPAASDEGAAAAGAIAGAAGEASTSGEEDDEADAAAIAALDARLESLQWEAELPALELAATVDELAALSARRLWRFVVVESGLLLRLHALRALALTARGDVFHSLVLEGGDMMAAKRPPTDRQLTNLLHSAAAAARAQLPARVPSGQQQPAEASPARSAGPGGAAAASHGAGVGGFAEGSEEHSRALLDLVCVHFELRLHALARNGDGALVLPSAATADPLDVSAAVLERWRSVRLWWVSEWPLNLVFNDECLRRYNSVFSFLLSLRVVQAQLQGAWLAPQTSLRGQREWQHARAAEARMRPLRALRAQMAFLVDAVQFYLHADVLEPAWAQLHARVQGSLDFEEVLRAHEAYLSSLAVHTFRHVPAASACLDAILTHCSALCALLGAAEDRTATSSLGRGDDAPYDEADFARIEGAFRESTSFLLEFLRGAQGASPGASPHLAQLLMRIDFNGFWSAHIRSF